MPLLLLGTWLVLALALYGSGRGLRQAALGAFAGLSVTVLLSVEALSVFRALTFPWLSAFWALALPASGWLLRRLVAEGWARVRQLGVRDWGPWDWVTAGLLAAFGLGTLLSATLYPAVNFDSLTYHLPRIFFWTQNHSAALYPTIEGRQLFSAPFAEYFVITLRMLAGNSDRVVNLVQWLSYLFAILTASLIAAELGASRRGQQAAAILAAATPMAVLQASTTQNDLTTALWCLVLAYCVVRYVRADVGDRGERYEWAGLTAAGLALAVQSKPTSYIVVAPFLLWLAIVALRREGIARTLALAGTVVGCALVLLAGTWIQNASAGVNVIGLSAPGNDRILIRSWGAGDLVVTGLKNTSMLLGSPVGRANEAIASTVRAVASALRVDVDARSIREYGAFPYALDPRITYHDTASSPLPLVIGFVAAVAALVDRRTRRLAWPYVACALVALFVPAAVMKYNHYVVRVLLPAVLLLGPLLGVAFDPRGATAGRALRTALAGLLALSLAWGLGVMLLNTTNRLVSPRILGLSPGRDVGYWNESYDQLRTDDTVPEFAPAFARITSAVKASGAHSIGIYQHEVDMPVYPLLMDLSGRQWGYIRDTVLPGRIDETRYHPQLVLEIAEDRQYPAVLHNGVRRGELLIAPQHASDWWFLLYRWPGPMGRGSGDVPTLR